MYTDVKLVGRVGNDAECAAENRPVKFSLATWKSIPSKEEKSGWETITHWHNVIAWGDEKRKKYLLDLVKKGTLVLVSGELETNTWVAEDGSTRKSIFVVANVIRKLRDNPNDTPKETQERSEPSPKSVDKEDDINMDDLPF